MNIESVCAEFLTYCTRERRLASNTIAAYEQDLAEFRKAFAGRGMNDICGRELVAYAHQLGTDRALAPTTVKRRVAPLKAMFSRLAKQGAIPQNPFGSVDLRPSNSQAVTTVSGHR